MHICRNATTGAQSLGPNLALESIAEMPLRVQVDGNSLNAALLSDTEWQALKGSRSLRMPCCDAPAYRRTSRLRTRHFAHSPRSHCGAEGECAEHLAAKAEIVRVCHELGWNALSEYVGNQWRADVYATRGRYRLAFEIQWSTQTLQVTRERHAAYGPDIKCCWLFKRLPSLNRWESGPVANETYRSSDYRTPIPDSMSR